jgi:hypothetical protein
LEDGSMSQSHAHTPASSRRRRSPEAHSARASATTAAGIAAERVALADRELQRRTAHARIAARRLDGEPAKR